jgi:3-oxoacyl-[acyl-carrier protein] reductase
MELGRDGITVNLVAPGWIPVERHGVIPAEIEQERLARQPIPRWGTPDDIADAVAYLVTDGAGFILGQHRRQRRYALQLSPSTAPGGRPPRST